MRTSFATPRTLLSAPAQRGLSLIELLIGMSIGMLTAATAMTTVLLVRSLSSTITELAHMQQQAAYAFRILGHQIRQAGGHSLEPSNSALALTELAAQPTALAAQPVHGSDHPGSNEYALTIRLANALKSLYTNKAGVFESKPLVRNCLNENPGLAKAAVLSSSFKHVDNELVCAGSGKPQAIISDVTDFQLRYLLRTDSDTAPSFLYVSASAVQAHQWHQVQAVEVCIALTGREHMDTAGATYLQCDGSFADYANRQRLVLRNHYVIRSH